MERTKKEVKIFLKEKLSMLIGVFGEKQIFGIFISGKINYQKIENFNSNYLIQIVYIPTAENLPFLTPLEAISLPVNLSINCNFIDFRQYLDSIYNKLDTLTESLYNDYFLINPYYESLYKKISEIWKDFITTYYQEKRIKYLLKKSKSILHMIPKNKDNLATALFLYYIAYGVNQQVSYDTFFNFKKNYPFQYQSIADLTEGLLSEIQINNIYETLNNSLDEFQIKVKEKIPSKEVKEEIEKTFKKIFQASLKDGTYVSNLTNLEQQALAAIKNAIGNEGYFSTTQLIKENDISRTVFMNLLKKIKEGNIAEVQSCGVKGTYVKFY